MPSLRNAVIGHFGNIRCAPYNIVRLLRERGYRAKIFFDPGFHFIDHPASEEGDFAVPALANRSVTGLEVQKSIPSDKWIPPRDWIVELHGGWRNHAHGVWLRRDLKTFGARYPLEVVRLLLEKDFTMAFEFLHYIREVDIPTLWVYQTRLGPVSRRRYTSGVVGGDITHAPFENSRFGRRMKAGLNQAETVFLTEPTWRRSAEALGLRRTVDIPWPVDTKRYSPGDGPEVRELRERFGGEPLFFCAARQYWEEKRSDWLIRAFARYLSSAPRAKLVLIAWGLDVEKSMALVKELGISGSVHFVPPMAKRRLLTHYRACDVAIDQFILKAYTLVGLEAMACGKPAISNYDSENVMKVHGEIPPLVRCESEGEIHQAMLALSDADRRAEIGRAERDWVVRHHDADLLIPRYVEVYERFLEAAH